MWVVHPRGFYSAVQKPEDVSQDMVTVRARVKADLVRLHDLLPDAKPYQETGIYTDYPWRMRVTREDWAEAARTMALEIDYCNFKDEVAKTDERRSHIYGGVWAALLRLEDLATRTRRRAADYRLD